MTNLALAQYFSLAALGLKQLWVLVPWRGDIADTVPSKLYACARDHRPFESLPRVATFCTQLLYHVILISWNFPQAVDFGLCNLQLDQYQLPVTHFGVWSWWKQLILSLSLQALRPTTWLAINPPPWYLYHFWTFKYHGASPKSGTRRRGPARFPSHSPNTGYTFGPWPSHIVFY